MADNSGRLTESQRAMAEALPHMVWTATPEGVVDYISREFERTTGMHGLNYANGDWLSAVHPDDREPTMAVWMAAIASGQPYQTEFRIFHAGRNDYRWHYVAAHPNRDASGRITQWFGSTVDIHDNKLAYTAIHRSEEQLRQVFEHDPHWVCVTDTSGTIQRINSAGLRLLGGGAGVSPVGAAVHQWVVPDDHTGLSALLHDAAGGKTGRGDIRLVDASGTVRVIDLVAAPLQDPSQGVYAVLLVGQDTTLARRETGLRELEVTVLNAISRERPLTEMFDEVTRAVDRLMPGVMSSIVLVIEGKMRHVSAPQLPDFYNQKVDGMAIGEGVGSCGTAAWRKKQVIVADILNDPLWEKARDIMQQTPLRACWSTPVLDAADTVLATFGMYYDHPRLPTPDDIAFIDRICHFVRNAIERTREREAMRALDERFRIIAQATNDVVWDGDLVSNTLWFSDGVRVLFGHEPASDPVLQTTSRVSEYIHPDDRERVRASMIEALKGKPSWRAEYRYQRRDGSYAHVVNQASILRGPDGRAVRAIGSLVDVTEQKALEEQLRRAQRLEAIGQMTGGVAHDFNNLLTVILGNAELLTESLTDDHRLRLLAEMTAKAAERGAELTNRLLAFARRQPLSPAVTDINRLIAGMDNLLRRTLGEALELEFVRAAGLWKAVVDAPQLESALLNLCINARDAMSQSGRLTIETANAFLDANYVSDQEELVAGQYVMIAVSDTGCGMGSETLARAFEPFYTTKEVGKGSGLGLSMVYGFVKQSKGHVRIYSEVGHGTTVRIYLPRALDENDIRRDDAERAGIQSGSERILLVEDDDLVREHVQSLLESLGYNVFTASNGPEALATLDTLDELDLLFTDVVMPGGMTGRQLAEAVRKRRPELPVIFTSGYTENAIVHHGRLDAGVHLLQKPYRRQELAAIVQRVLAARDGSDGSGES